MENDAVPDLCPSLERENPGSAPLAPPGAVPEQPAQLADVGPATPVAPGPHKRKRRSGPKRKLSEAERLERNAVRAIVRGVLRTVAGKVPDLRAAEYELRAFVRSVAADLGGARALSAAQRELLGLAAVQSRVVRLMGGVLAANPGLAISRGRNGSSPLSRDYNSATDRLRALLEALGLEKKASAGPSLQEYLAARAASKE